MGIDIKIRNTKVWRDDKTSFPKYSVAVSKKMEDGYVNKYIPVKFTRECGNPNVSNGEILNIDGFIGLDVWVGQDGTERKELVFIANNYSIPVDNSSGEGVYIGDLGDSFQAAEDDIPF